MLELYEQAKGEVLNYLTSCIELAHRLKETSVAQQLERTALDIRNMRFKVAVVGDIKRGKSTLINTLLGQDNDTLSPVNSAVCTGCIVYYMDLSVLTECESPHAKVYFYGKADPERVDFLDIEDYITEDANPNNRRGVARVEIYGHFPLLHSCCLVDTPGANAVIERHGEMVYDLLPSADAVIMAVMAGQAMTTSEAQMLQALSGDEQRKIFYVLTQIDREDPTTLPQICDWVKKKIRDNGLNVPSSIYQVACKPVFDALCKHESAEVIQNLRGKWGVSALESDVERFMLHSSLSGKALAQKAAEAVQKARQAFEQRRQNNALLIETQNVDARSLAEERKRVEAEFKNLRVKMERRIADFEKRWNRITEHAVNDLPHLAPRLQLRIQEQVAASKGVDAFTNAFQVGSMLRRCIQEPISEYTEKVVERYQKQVDKLDEDLQEELGYFNSQVKGSGSAVAVGGSLVAVSAAATAVANAVPFGSAVATAASAWAAASAQVASVSLVGKVLAWLGVGAGKVVLTTEAMAWATLTASLTAAVVPMLIALVAMYLSPSIARYITNAAIPGKLEDALKEVAEKLRKQGEDYRNAFVEKLREKLDDAEEEMTRQLDDISEKLAELDPAVKEQAEQENQEIALLTTQGEDVRRQTYLLQ